MSYSIELTRPGQAIIRDGLGNDSVGIAGVDAERIYTMATRLQEADPAGIRANDFLAGFVSGSEWMYRMTGIKED